MTSPTIGDPARILHVKPGQWGDLISRLGEIENPVVPTTPSKYATPTKKRSSEAHVGE